MELANVVGDGTSLISLHILPDYHLHLIQRMLSNELATAVHIKGKYNRASVLSAISLAIVIMADINKIPENGLCIYCGYDVNGEIVKSIFSPEMPIIKGLYLIDNKFHVLNTPLLQKGNPQ
jgi:peptide chain release factor subunit 1